jgi:hypothetical protein
VGTQGVRPSADLGLLGTTGCLCGIFPFPTISCATIVIFEQPPEFRVKLTGEVIRFIQSQLQKYLLIVRDSDILQRALQPDEFVSDSIYYLFLFIFHLISVYIC